jgi:pimeloyl-ACP methyl ester carboxylesterase
MIASLVRPDLRAELSRFRQQRQGPNMNDQSADGTRRRFLTATAATAVGGSTAMTWSESVNANLPAPTRGRGYAPWAHGLVHYYDNGVVGSGTPIVLLHQAPQSARQFDSVYPALAKRNLRAIGIDTPGFGMSDPTPFVPTIADWIPAIVAVLDALKIERCDVVGHHTGALMATEMALQAPKRVRNVVINGPFPITDEERGPRLENLKKSEIDFEYKADGTHLSESFMRRFTMYGPGADPKLTTRVMVEKFQGFGPFWYGHNAAYRYDHGAAMKKLTHRTLLLTNTGDMIYDMAQRSRAMRPDFEYAELKGGGVDIVDQQPEQWADVIAAFVGTSATGRSA